MYTKEAYGFVDYQCESLLVRAVALARGLQGVLAGPWLQQH